jgi:hypothetical protein
LDLGTWILELGSWNLEFETSIIWRFILYGKTTALLQILEKPDRKIISKSTRFQQKLVSSALLAIEST